MASLESCLRTVNSIKILNIALSAKICNNRFTVKFYNNLSKNK